jgi:hypothetical protein
MITFNDVLRSEGIDPANVRLVRHQDSRVAHSSIYATWRQRDNGHALVEEYQSLQSRRVFEVGDLLASFVVTPPPRGDTLFIGLYSVVGVKPEEHGIDPILGHIVKNGLRYDIVHDLRLSHYVERLTIDWGGATRSWVQRAARQPKPVLSIQDRSEPPWPGFSQFCVDVSDVPGLYASWQEVLRTVKGIYLLVDLNTGDQYIGSAKGEESLFGRLMEYATNGHGGNIELRARRGARYRVSLLEVVDMSLPDKRIEALEAVWKRKLTSRNSA